MAWQDVYRKYDENGNVVGEVKFNEGTQEYNAAKQARESGGGQVGDWYIKGGTGNINSKISAADRASQLVDAYTPQIKVNKTGDGLVISGTKAAINSDLGKQLKKYLDDTFKYADLKSANTQEALEQLNKDLYSQIEERVVSGGLGMNYEDYKEYRNTLQQFQGTNPLKSTVKIPGYSNKGKEYKTVSEWLDYYQKKYSATERANLFKNSLQAMSEGDIDPVAWTPYLVMAGGNVGASPTYGFSTGDRLAVGWESFLNDVSAKLIEGQARNFTRAAQYLTNIGGYQRKENLDKIVEDVNLGRNIKSSDVKWMNEKAFNKKLDSIIGKKLEELSDGEKAFIATAISENFKGGDRISAKLAIADENGVVTDDVKNFATYDSYANARDNLSTVEKYDEAMDERVADLERGREWLQRDIDLGTIYAPAETTIGAFAGTMLRMWAEAQLINGVTGGAFNPAAISDKIAEGIMGMVQKVAPASRLLQALQTPVGSFLLSATAELPEDVVQTVIDDVLIGRSEDIPKLAPTGNIDQDMAKLGESFAQNLAFRLAFTPIHVGATKVRQWNAAKQAAKAIGMDETVSDQLFLRNQKAAEAANNGTIVDLTDNSVTIRNPDGTEEVLDNVAMLHFATDEELQERFPAIAEMVRKKGLMPDTDIDPDTAKIFDDPEEMESRLRERERIPQENLDNAAPVSKYFEGYEVKRIESDADIDSIIDNKISQRVQQGWYADSGDVLRPSEAREVMAIAALRNTDLRNAALNKAYNVFYEINPDAPRLSFEEWAETPITLVRKFDPEGGVGASSANVLSYSMRPGGLATETYGEGIDTISIAPKNTVGMLLGADDAGFRDEGEIFVPTALIEGHPKYLSVGDIVDAKKVESAADMDEAPSSASYQWESPDVTKTYTSSKEVMADMPVGKNMTEVRQWQKNAEAFYMNRYRETTMPVFNEKYPTVDEQQQFVRNMDFLFDQQRIEGETIETAVGKTYENEGITYTVKQEDIDFYNANVEPIMADLREAGAAGQGKEAFTITGYLPHSDYDPTLLTAEDSMQQGVLWREYTGASTTSEDGNFSTGWLDTDLEARYRTFVNNMLWDSLGDEVMVAKYMEEFNADGLDTTVNNVEKMVGGRKRLASIVSQSDSAKAVVKHLTGKGEMPTDVDIDTTASKIGATDAVHGIYHDIYGSSNGLNQRGNVALMSKSDWMRTLTTGDGSLYDNGGAMLVGGAADAKYMAKRIFDAVDNGEQVDVHKMFSDYLMQNNRRTAKGASFIADKWMDKIAQKATNGGISRRELTAELSHLIYNEGANRVFRFIGRMDTSKLNASNRKALDSLLFRHSVLSKVINTSGFTAKLNKATNAIISARMKSLFWLNFKNAVLQSSECIRLFTEFKFGDALETIQKLAIDEAFRKEVDEWVDMLVPERYIKGDSSAAVDAAATIAKNSEYKNGELTVNKLSQGDLNSVAKKFDEFASSPVEMGESLKNRVLMAGILQEAHAKGLEGNELFSYVNQRFERIGLAANEMGRLNASDSPLFRLGANLKTFQIRQLSMFLNNIKDMNGTGEAVTYILKNLGWKAGLAVVMSKLGYSAAATLGIDPFDLMDDDYTGVDEDNYTGLDYLVLSPAGKLFLSGGFTGYINDLYWASRKAYEDSAEITEETENRLDKGFWPGMALPGTSFDDVLSSFTGFIPGYTAGKRVIQMNELLDAGWAVSGTGNKMYQAPNDLLGLASGYAFGRSNTPNARAYYQTPDYLQGFLDYGLAGVGQQLGREFGSYRQFDPIDQRNYSDWFNGTGADEQQWNSGYYYFLNKVRDMNDEYSKSLTSYTTDEQKEALRTSYNKRLAEIEEQLKRFTSAYESKHPEGIDQRKMKNLINVLNIYQPVMADTPEEAEERSLDAYGDALSRYSQAGLPAVTSYKRDDETGEIEVVYSPQLRSALQGQFGLPEEAATQIKKLYKDKWKDLNQQYRDKYYSTKGSKAKKAIQNEYISIVRQDLDPIVKLYGGNIWSNEEVENIIDDVFNSMIPKYGQTAKSYLKNLYKDYSGTLRYNEKGNETLKQINKLLDQGKTAQGKALARTLLQRVQENRTSLTRTELERLQSILK